MIQLNLLPDVKLEYIKARRTKRLVILGSAIVTGASVALVALLFIATNVLQRTHLNNLKNDIEESSKELKEVEGLDKILTVQNQLNSLDELHAEKPATGRLGKYLAQLTPREVKISNMQVDYVESAMKLEGTASSLRVVNQFIDAMKFTTYKAGEESGEAFSNVVLANFDRSDLDKGNNEGPVTYEITLSFNPVIFDNALDVQIVVPETITTQSADRPSADSLFQLDEEFEVEE